MEAPRKRGPVPEKAKGTGVLPFTDLFRSRIVADFLLLVSVLQDVAFKYYKNCYILAWQHTFISLHCNFYIL